jgi:hypothetical protein
MNADALSGVPCQGAAGSEGLIVRMGKYREQRKSG